MAYFTRSRARAEHKSAGVLPFSLHEGSVLVLLGAEPCKTGPGGKFWRTMWRDFGGAREAADADSEATAAREFAEETLGLFGACGVDASSVALAAAAMEAQLHAPGRAVKVVHALKRGSYHFFITQQPFVAPLMFRLASQQNAATGAVPGAEKSAFAWVPLHALLECVAVAAPRYFLETRAHVCGSPDTPQQQRGGRRRFQLHPCFARSLRMAQEQGLEELLARAEELPLPSPPAPALPPVPPQAVVGRPPPLMLPPTAVQLEESARSADTHPAAAGAAAAVAAVAAAAGAAAAAAAVAAAAGAAAAAGVAAAAAAAGIEVAAAAAAGAGAAAAGEVVAEKAAAGEDATEAGEGEGEEEEEGWGGCYDRPSCCLHDSLSYWLAQEEVAAALRSEAHVPALALGAAPALLPAPAAAAAAACSSQRQCPLAGTSTPRGWESPIPAPAPAPAPAQSGASLAPASSLDTASSLRQSRQAAAAAAVEQVVHQIEVNSRSQRQSRGGLHRLSRKKRQTLRRQRQQQQQCQQQQQQRQAAQGMGVVAGRDGHAGAEGKQQQQQRKRQRRQRATDAEVEGEEEGEEEGEAAPASPSLQQGDPLLSPPPPPPPPPPHWQHAQRELAAAFQPRLRLRKRLRLVVLES